MEFMGVGPTELLVVMVLALLVLGPQRLTQFARSAGRLVRQMREMGGEFSRALMDEAEDEAPGPHRRG